MKGLDGLICLITGAGQGIGREISLRFAKEGASLVLCDINLETLKDVEKEINSNFSETQVVVSMTDISKEEQIRKLVELTYEKYNALNILINNAAITVQGNLIKLSNEEWDYIMNVNLKGTWMMCKHFANRMRKQRQFKPRGKIINIGSTASKVGLPIIGAYSISKFGVLGLTQSLAKELAPHITVNQINLGMIKTPIYKDNDELMNVMMDQYKLYLWMKDWGEPSDIAGMAYFLASSDSNFITGQAFNVNGGLIMH